MTPETFDETVERHVQIALKAFDVCSNDLTALRAMFELVIRQKTEIILVNVEEVRRLREQLDAKG
jgi:hypothetical protein